MTRRLTLSLLGLGVALAPAQAADPVCPLTRATTCIVFSQSNVYACRD